MSNKANPALIGGFILGALALLVALVLLFASGTFSHSQKSIIYFEGSVNGLNIGALVKLKGVAVGKVTDILVVYDEQHGKIMTPVIVEFEPQKIFDTKGEHLYGAGPKDMKKLVDQGLRAQLQMQSLVTGQLFVDINFRPSTPMNLVGGENQQYPEIPSIPSPKEQLENTIEEVVSKLRKMPLEQTFQALLSTILELEKLVKSPQIGSSLTTIDHTLKDLQHVIQHLDGKIDPLTDGLNGSLKEGRNLLATINQNATPVMLSAQEAMKATTSAMNQANTALTTINQAAGQNASLDLALKDLALAAKSLRVLADYLERYPDALLYGKSPNGN
jgi:paraquat-inducible protein B